MNATRPPRLLSPWLNQGGSLTTALTQQASGHFKVQRLFEGFVYLKHIRSFLPAAPYSPYHTPSIPVLQRTAFPFAAHQRVWCRQVLLFGSSRQPWVIATTLCVLKKQNRRLPHLKSKPLGKLMFNRGDLHYTRRIVSPARMACATAPQCPTAVFARQSCYYWHKQPLWIEEAFTEAFITHLQQHPTPPRFRTQRYARKRKSRV